MFKPYGSAIQDIIGCRDKIIIWFNCPALWHFVTPLLEDETGQQELAEPCFASSTFKIVKGCLKWWLTLSNTPSQ